MFGTSPPYLQLCEDGGYSPRRAARASARCARCSRTGSILHDWQFDWVAERRRAGAAAVDLGRHRHRRLLRARQPEPARHARRDPVPQPRAGRAGAGEDATSSGVGELVCATRSRRGRSASSATPDGARFHAAYFAQNPGVWTHGDLIEFDDDGSARMHGRSDGVLNVQRHPRSARPRSTACCAACPRSREAMAVEQPTPGERRGLADRAAGGDRARPRARPAAPRPHPHGARPSRHRRPTCRR